MAEHTAPKETASRVETLAALWDHAIPGEREETIRVIFDAVSRDPADQRLAALQPKLKIVVLFRETGALPDDEGLVSASDRWTTGAGLSAPDWSPASECAHADGAGSQDQETS